MDSPSRLLPNSGSALRAGALPHEDPRQTLQHAENTMKRSQVPPLDSYFEAVDAVQTLVESLSLEPSDRRDNSSLDQAENILQLAMSRLEEEFKHLLESHSESVDPEWLFDPVANPSFGSMSGEIDLPSGADEPCDGEEEVATSRSMSNVKLHIDMLPAEIVPDLCDIAQRMIRSGYETECCQVYIQLRKNVLEESLYRLGLEKLSIEDVQKMSWECLETEIVKWMEILKVSVGVLFPSEKHVCGQVFEGSPSIAECCFAEIGKGAVMQLLNFGEAVAIGRRSPEKLSRILDMYEKLRFLLPDINSIFSGAACEIVRSDASGILNRLGEAARGTFAEFENAIKRDTAQNTLPGGAVNVSRPPLPGGAVHPLTRWLMNYLRLLSCSLSTLNQILGERRSGEMVPSLGDETSNLPASPSNDNVSEHQEDSPISIRILGLMDLLEENIEAKAKLYKDMALTFFFRMNNYQYIVQKGKASEVRSLLSDDWLRRRMGKVRQYHNMYLRAAWTRVLTCLKDEGIHMGGSSFSGSVSRTVLKERFKAFNAAFEETVKVQQSWIVSDPQLRVDLRISIVEMLLPAYRAFLGRFRNHLDSERHPERYAKYSAEDLESILNDLFEEGPPSVHRRRSLSTS